MAVFSSCGADDIKVRISLILASKPSRLCFDTLPVLVLSTVSLASVSDTVLSSLSPKIESIKSYTPESSQNSLMPNLSSALSVAYSVTGLHTNVVIIIKILIAINHMLFLILSHSALGENCFLLTISVISSLISSCVISPLSYNFSAASTEKSSVTISDKKSYLGRASIILAIPERFNPDIALIADALVCNPDIIPLIFKVSKAFVCSKIGA